ncbi:MAG: hypothetical protein O7G30_06590 [Proteobacteria bacterium]|nr:hypothetical protein [Pseudomonadota bacterium]
MMQRNPQSQPESSSGPGEGYQRPTIEVISLACEISAYAPDDGDTPLF